VPNAGGNVGGGMSSTPLAVTTEVLGAWASMVTAVVAVAGGGWALWRYSRQKPDLPRVNVSVSASLYAVGGIDYVSFDATVTHVAGDTLSIDQGGTGEDTAPHVAVRRLARASDEGDLPATLVVTCPALRQDTTLSGGELTHEEGIVSVGRRLEDTIAYDVRFVFAGRWMNKSWTWSPNKILRVDASP
jgi:hypothetical protein